MAYAGCVDELFILLQFRALGNGRDFPPFDFFKVATKTELSFRIDPADVLPKRLPQRCFRTENKGFLREMFVTNR